MQKYDILGMIGEGAYGVVLKCKCNHNQQTVAVKKFKQSEEDDQIVKKTTMRQVKILKMIKHPNIVQLREAFRKKGIVYLVFEYVQNNLLEVLEKSQSGLHPDLIKSFVHQMLKGLAYMHSQGLVHRDVKPQNLLISDKKQLKICDFGFARQLKSSKQQQLTDYVATRWYRPPQLLVGNQYDYAIDMWAVGCIMGQLIDGNPMFPGQNQLDQLFLIQKCLGPLTPDLKETFIKNPRFLGMKFPQIHTLESIQKRYIGKASPKAINFMKSLLKMNPSQRMTAAQALKHPYFEGRLQQQHSKKFSTESISLKLGKSQIESKNTTSPSTQHKKNTPTPYNLFLQQKQKTETTQPQFDRSSKVINKKQGLNMANSKGFVGVTSKSLNKNTKVSNKYMKPKNISLQKHKNRDIIIKTQTGFYISNQNSRGKYMYDKQNGIPVMTQQAEQDQIWQPNQLPSIVISNQKAEKSSNLNSKNQRNSGFYNPKTYH